MEAEIRKETEEDFSKVFNLIELAFKNEKYSDHQEQFLVQKLRDSDVFEPELSLVAEFNKEIVGYILLTKIKIKNGIDEHLALALAPVAVLPAYQKRGIGAQLIRTAHSRAATLGYGAVVVLGHENYYPKFGYQPAEKHGIQLPFDVPKENCTVKELRTNALKGVHGMVEYAKEFYS